MAKVISDLTNWVKENDDIAIIPHVSPDGDALGSTIALFMAFQKLGKRARVVCADPVPKMFAFLPGVQEVRAPGALDFEPKGLLFVDVAALDRAGDKGALSGKIGNWALLDHHETNPGFADVSLVDGSAPASGIMVVRLLNELGVSIDRDMATLLYAAISTDTGNFSYTNTTSEAYQAAARLLEAGFDLEDVNYRLFRLRSVARTRLLGAALSRLELYEDGSIAMTRLDQEIFDACGADYSETEGVVNFLIEMEGVKVAMTCEAREGGASTKFSLRSRDGFDVAAIAHSFNGGGHINAAGMNLNLPIDQAAERALDAVRRALR